MDVLLLLNLLPGLLVKTGMTLIIGDIIAVLIKFKRDVLKAPMKKIKPQKTIKGIIDDRKLINESSNTKASIDSIEEFIWGYRVVLDIAGVVAFSDLEKEVDYIKTSFRAKQLEISYQGGKAIIDIISRPIEELGFEHKELLPTQLIIGHDLKGIPIIVDMIKTPHIGVQGASNSGKSKGIELALKNLNGEANIIFLNVFEEDFKTVKGIRVNGNENILKFLRNLIDNPKFRIKPLYLVLDELNVLGKDKEINKAIQDVLSQARHYNIYLIALGQSLLKENCPYKQLFNVRITFRAIDKSTISAFLGTSIEDTELLQQEFICYSDNIYRGRTYNYDFR